MSTVKDIIESELLILRNQKIMEKETFTIECERNSIFIEIDING